MDAALTRIGHYQPLRRLGAGGMGEVLLARDTRLEREVALKLLPPEFAQDAERVERFRREALHLASLNHPSIATLYGIEAVPGGGLALVMEFVAGETLAARLERGALPVAEAIDVAVQIADALEVAHARGVVHRDLKPPNISFSERGRPKVLDFGLARRQEREEAGEVEGTPGYMSPEQALGAPQDHRTDVFAFGCLLYECLAGVAAFPGADPWARISATLHAEPDLARLPAELPEAVRALIAQSLAKSAESRPAHMREVRERLEALAGAPGAAEAAAETIPPHHLPTPPGAFIGRDRERRIAVEALGRERIVTLTGVGGCGKTRLALAVAQTCLPQFADGAWFVDLAPLADGERVPEAVARVLGVREEADRPLEDTLADAIGTRRLLLLLDNCEHLISACAALTEDLLARCSQLHILATSREGLGVTGEQLLAVPSLSAPQARDATDPDSLARFDAVQLFLDRARAVAPTFELEAASAPAVAEICRRLDGIPLAIELAAARAKVLAPAQIAARLDDRFKLLTGGSRTALPRHQTLRATLQWSHDLLLPPERELLRRLAAFAGGWTLEHAARVCDQDGDEFAVLDVLQHLVDKSLVLTQRGPSGDARYRMLESVRQFATERLDESGEGPVVRERHLACMLELAEHTEQALSGPLQAAHYPMLDAEQENLLAALAWCEQAEDGASRGLRLAASLWRYWSGRQHYDLGRRVLETALSRPGAEVDSPERAHALVRAGGMALYQGDYAAARPHIEQSLALYRRLGDERGVARALAGLAVVAMYQGDYATARVCNEESLAGYRALGAVRGEGVALHNIGYLAWCEGRGEDSERWFSEALVCIERVGDAQQRALTLAGLGAARLLQGQLDAAREPLATALELSLEQGIEREGAYAVEMAAELALREDRAESAARLIGAARALRTRIGSPSVPAEDLARQRQLDRLAERLGAAVCQQQEAEGATWTGHEALVQALLAVRPHAANPPATPGTIQRS